MAQGRSIKRSPFAATVARADRRTGGHTWAPATPLAVRTSGLTVEPALRERIHQRLGWRLGKFAPRIERLSVRFEDVNGPRGGVDVACRIKAVLSALPSVVVMELAHDPVAAFDRAGQRLERAVRRAVGRGRERGRLGPVPLEVPRAAGARRAAAPRPAASTATRNRKRRAPKATVALEGSARSRPSRKSTRGSANRAKHGNKLARRESRRAASPKGRRARADKKH
ncbi:MAG TPA: HPF/RaiA family ribosome-associated protein [Polyangia bacterium]|jgi:ribosome-associated translation inhibitor RaiA